MSEKGMPTVVASTRSHRFPSQRLARQANSQTALPDATSPARVAKLTGHRTEVLATLIDLARREHFDQYLPQAAALRRAEAWGRQIQKLEGALPTWFPLIATTAAAGDFGAAAALVTAVEVGP